MTNEQYRLSVKVLNSFRFGINRLIAGYDRKQFSSQSIFAPIVKVHIELNKTIPVQHEYIEQVFNTRLPLPSDAFLSGKRSVAMWIGTIRKEYTRIDEQLSQALLALPEEARLVIEEADVGSAVSDLDLSPSETEGDIDWPEPPEEIEDRNAFDDIREWYESLPVRPDYDFENGTFTFECDWDGGGS